MRTVLRVLALSAWVGALGTAALAGLGIATPTPAQDRDRRDRRDREEAERDALPRDVARDVVHRYNEPAALRASGSLDIPDDQEVAGNVAVLNGPLTIRGRVRGDVIVVNGDVILKRGSRIDGDLILVGGIIEGQDDAVIGGQIESYRQALRYHEEDGELVADRDTDEPWEPRDRHAERWYHRYQTSSSRLLVTTGNPYNRVEGLAVMAGPQLRFTTDFAKIKLEGLGILRSADHFAWKAANLGHDVKGEIALGGRSGIAFGARAFDVVDGVEEWQLKDSEVGLATFFLHRDYRDYFNRHGAGAYARVFVGDALSLTGGYTEERWSSRDARDPWTLFRGNAGWRNNPRMDEGRFRITTAALRIDTRNDEDDPWSGWFINLDGEYGESDAVTLAPRGDVLPPSTVLPVVNPGPVPMEYKRAFLDLRRYNRVSPEGQLNFRVVLGGQIGEDQLPLQRRLSLGGPGSLPGYDFRDVPSGTDMLMCGATAFTVEGEPIKRQSVGPALCERIALAQVEYRGDLRISLNLGGDVDDDNDDRHDRRRHWGVRHVGQWVVFADAGRGWMVGDARVGNYQYRDNEFPDLKTFRSDVGAGLDFDVLGFFIAKSTSDSGERPNFFVRVRHRF